MDDRILVGSGWSSDPDPRKAGYEAAHAALAECHGDADIVFVFATVDYEPHQLLAGVRDRVGVCPVHGGTSFTGVIGPAGFLASAQGVVSVMALSTPYIQFGAGYADLGKDAVAAGRAAAEMAASAPDVTGGAPEVILMTASPGREEAVIQGIIQVWGEDVPIIGGSVADNSVEGKWSVFGNKAVMKDGVVVTAFYSSLPLGYAYGSGYRPTDKKAVITKAAGRTIYELDGKRAVDVYASWTGLDAGSLAGMNILGASLLKPVGVRDAESNFCLVKHPGVVQDDGSIAFFADVRQGEELVLLEATVDELLAEIEPTIQKAMDMASLEREDVAALILVHCGGRRGAIGDRMGEVPEAIRRALGPDVPFISYLTFGEQGCLDTGQNVHCDLLLSALVIGK